MIIDGRQVLTVKALRYDSEPATREKVKVHSAVTEGG